MLDIEVGDGDNAQRQLTVFLCLPHLVSSMEIPSNVCDLLCYVMYSTRKRRFGVMSRPDTSAEMSLASLTGYALFGKL